MVFAVVVLVLALGVGFARGGDLDSLGHLPLRRRALVVLALLAQVAGALVGGPAYPAGLAASALLIAWFLHLNRGVQGTGLVALGLAANALVVGLNGAMPVDPDVLGRARISTQDILSGADPRHELEDDATRLAVLGDKVPVLLPGHAEVVSAGDVAIAAGLGELVVLGMGSRRRRR